MIDVLAEWQSRGFLHQVTDRDKLAEHLSTGSRRMYCGYDPTASSLQLGNLVPLMMKAHAQRAGHRPVVVAGGFTGMIGDPSGKTSERLLLSAAAVQENVEVQRPIFEAILDFDSARTNKAEWLNNADWLNKLSLIEFLRDYGKLFSINELLRRDNVRIRLEEREHGISFTEFSYGILQSIDFLNLYRAKEVTVQLGGSDQWGNLVSGIDLVRRVTGETVFGVTAPLIKKSDGQKFGKTEAGAVWLSAGRTSPFAYFQFWLNTADEDVERYLRLFTFLGLDEISDVMHEHDRDRARRNAQRRLAAEATAILHGGEETGRAEAVSGSVFSGDLATLNMVDCEIAFGNISSSQHDRSALARGLPVIDLLVNSGMCVSKREARELVRAGAIQLNGRKAVDGQVLSTDSLLGHTYLMISKGKKVRHLTRWS